MIWRDRCFRSLVLASILIFLFGSIKPEPVDPLVASREASNWFWTYKVHNKNVYDMVLIGDSRLYRGISPSAMQDVLGKDFRILNFGFSSGGINKRMIKEALNRLDVNSKRKTVVLAVTPFSLTTEAAKNEHFLKEFTRPKEDVIQRLAYSPWWDFFKPVTPSLVRDFLLGKQKAPPILYYQDFYSDGWVGSRTIPSDPDRAIKSYVKTFEKYQVDNNLINELCEQVRVLKARDINVFAFRPPVSNSMLALESKMSGFDQRRFVEQFHLNGGMWIDIHSSGYKTYDGSHMFKDSAIKYSTELARKVEKFL